MDELKAGVYRHYKGPLYLVLGLAHDANSGEESVWSDRAGDYVAKEVPVREVIVYIGLQTDSAHTGARLAVRTVEDFFAWVHPDGTRCDHQTPGVWCDNASGEVRQRFEYVSARWDG